MKKLSTLFAFLLSLNAYPQYLHNGYAPDLIQLQGSGNSDNFLELTNATISSIITNYFNATPTYKGHFAPIKISVYDTSAIVPGTYQIKFDSVGLGGNWKMYRVGTTDTVFSSQTIGSGLDQFIPSWGLAVTVNQLQVDPYEFPDTIAGIQEYQNPSLDWLGWIKDDPSNINTNWQGSGVVMPSYIGHDGDSIYQTFAGGWSPYFLCNESPTVFDDVPYPIAYELKVTRAMSPKQDLYSCDIVFSNDTSKWTRCPVIEMCGNSALSIGAAEKQFLRESPSVDKMGNPDGTGYGMGWFPGYAINVETGERMNMAFGENSSMPQHNGTDMLFNPTDSLFSSTGEVIFGGQHYIYVFQNQDEKIPLADRMTRYDGGTYIETQLKLNTAAADIRVWRACTWVGLPLTKPGHSVLETDAIIKLRIVKPYDKYLGNSTVTNWMLPLFEFEMSLSGLLSVNEKVENNNLVFVYPNPSNGRITFLLNEIGNSIETIRLFNAGGQLVYTNENLSGNTTTLETGNYAKGIYFYQLSDNNNKVYSGKVVFE